MPKIKGEKRTVRICFRLTSREAERFDKARGKTSRAIAARLLSLCLPPPKPASPEVAKLAGDLNRIGNNLNQIARALNQNQSDTSMIEIAKNEVKKLREAIA